MILPDIKPFKNYAELIAAFKDGRLDPKCCYLMLDKGGNESYLRHRYDPRLSYDENDTLSDYYANLWSNGEEGITGVLDAIDIPWEWC